MNASSTGKQDIKSISQAEYNAAEKTLELSIGELNNILAEYGYQLSPGIPNNPVEKLTSLNYWIESMISITQTQAAEVKPVMEEETLITLYAQQKGYVPRKPSRKVKVRRDGR